MKTAEHGQEYDCCGQEMDEHHDCKKSGGHCPEHDLSDRVCPYGYDPRGCIHYVQVFVCPKCGKSTEGV